MNVLFFFFSFHREREREKERRDILRYEYEDDACMVTLMETGSIELVACSMEDYKITEKKKTKTLKMKCL